VITQYQFIQSKFHHSFCMITLQQWGHQMEKNSTVMCSHFDTKTSLCGRETKLSRHMLTNPTICILCDSILWLFTNIHIEHEYFWSHRRHFVVETVLVHAIRMSRKCIFAIALAITRIYAFAIWTRNLKTVTFLTN